MVDYKYTKQGSDHFTKLEGREREREKNQELGVIKRFKVLGLMKNQENVSNIKENMESDDFENLRPFNDVSGTDGNYNENADVNTNTEEERRFHGEIEEIIDIVETEFYKFKNFQVINDHIPYNFNKYKDNTVNIRNPIKIFKEWKTLEAGLPKSIFVRVYKSRIDIARAVIVGPEGTPYNNILFLFDILFPSDYPNYPPHLFYRSYGLELLPYLHHDGKVYHSLLNEGWNPKESNLLEVLVTIHNQLLNSHNDYIDGGYQLMQIYMTMINLLNCPPMNFEIYVKGFYRTRAHYILLKYKAQLAKIVGDDHKDMQKMFFELVKKFEGNGTYCKHHYKEEEFKKAFKDEKKIDHVIYMDEIEEMEEYNEGSNLAEDYDQLDHQPTKHLRKMFWKLSDFASKIFDNFKFYLMELLMEDVVDHL